MTYILHGLTIISFVILFYLSHQNGEATHKTSITVTKILFFLSTDKQKLHMNLRHFAHIVLFAVFSFFYTLTLHTLNLPYYLLSFPIIYTWADEATKVFIPGRHFSWFDVGYNFIGTVIGIAAGFYIIL